VGCALRGEGCIVDEIRARRQRELGVSAITLAELRFGAGRRRSRRLHRIIDTFVGDVAVVPFDRDAADRFARVAAALVSAGTPIGTLDTMIAAHALQLGLTLVTHNVRHFQRVRGLDVVDWV